MEEFSSHNYENVFEFGIKNGKLVHVDEVENGLACCCICPECEAPLVAHNNLNNKRARHFQHKGKSDCKNAYESALHFLAKQIIQEKRALTVPNITFSLPSEAEAYLETVNNPYYVSIVKQEVKFDKVEIEKSQLYFRPDLKCYVKDKILLIEIAVTHFVDEVKRNKIIDAGIPLLEIDLASYDRSIQKDKLIGILNGNIEGMKWIYNPKMNEARKNIIQQGQALRDFVSANTKDHKVYGKNHDIYDCPIYIQQNAISSDDYCQHCRYFVQELEGLIETSDAESKFPNYVVSCIGHKASEYIKLLIKNNIQVKNRN